MVMTLALRLTLPKDLLESHPAPMSCQVQERVTWWGDASPGPALDAPVVLCTPAHIGTPEDISEHEEAWVPCPEIPMSRVWPGTTPPP